MLPRANQQWPRARGLRATLASLRTDIVGISTPVQFSNEFLKLFVFF